ncbi:hypothetical protein BH23PAT2_BH23PAT2_08720 [soil metagenome]
MILENGFWSKNKRQELRDEATDIGALVKIEFLDLPLDELWRRASVRSETKEVGMLHFTKNDLEKWSKIFEPPTADELE